MTKAKEASFRGKPPIAFAVTAKRQYAGHCGGESICQKKINTRLVNPDQEKNLLAQAHGRGVTERDKKFLESFRKSYMEKMKQP
jgi:hypothetical protein